jgi:cytosine/adenosine deaminase-related metal-dependent hydrolase
MNPEADLLVRAGWLVERSGLAHRGGGLLLRDGCVHSVLREPRELDALERKLGLEAQDASDCVVAPALVNAHAHLELGALRGELGPGADFSAWIRQLIGARAALRPQALQAGLHRAARELLRSGTSLVADIDSLGLEDPELPLRRVRYVEVLDAQDPARSPAARARAQGQRHIAPHAPYTLRVATLQELGRLAAAQTSWLSIHWAETPEEEHFLEGRAGPFAALLPTSAGGRGLERLEAAGLLGPRTMLVHGNAATPAERARVAASGATLVHCPGTHRWFDRPRFAWAEWEAAGVELALGTDSLASNTSSSMRQELAWLRQDQPQLDPWRAHAAATLCGARALGEAGRAGCLSAGANADAIVLRGLPGSHAELGEFLCDPGPPLAEFWIAGRSCREFL